MLYILVCFVSGVQSCIIQDLRKQLGKYTKVAEVFTTLFGGGFVLIKTTDGKRRLFVSVDADEDEATEVSDDNR